LMASERAWDMQTDLSVTLLTPEKTPLAIFGADVSQELARLLEDRKITVITSAYCEIPEAKTIRIHPGDRSLEVDHIVALPELRGPAIPGLPSDIGGFIPIDDYARVAGAKHVWAAGDATDFPNPSGRGTRFSPSPARNDGASQQPFRQPGFNPTDPCRRGNDEDRHIGHDGRRGG